MAEYKLSDEAIAAGLSFGQNQNIREEDRQAALAQFRAQMNSEDSPYIRDIPQNQSVGLSDAQAAQLMGRPVNQPQMQQSRAGQSPQTSNASRRSGAFESGYPIPRIENYVPFEGTYPGPRNVQLPPQMFNGNQNMDQGLTPATYLNSRVNPYVQDAASNFLSREDRAYQNAPMSQSIVNNPARERLTRAIGEGSANVYEDRRREAVNERQMPNILAKQARDELTEYQARKGPYYDGKKAPTNKQLKERMQYFFNRMGQSSEDEPEPTSKPDPARVQRMIDGLNAQNRARSYPGSGSSGMKKGGAVKKTKSVAAKSKASKRGDGIAQRGKTKGRMV